MNEKFPSAATFHPKHLRSWRHRLCLILGTLFLSICSVRAAQTLFEGTSSQEAVAKLSEKLKAPVRVLKIEIQPETLSIQVQDPAAPTQVNEYSYQKLTGLTSMLLPSVTGPRPVRLNLINPNLEENLFD